MMNIQTTHLTALALDAARVAGALSELIDDRLRRLTGHLSALMRGADGVGS